MRTRRATIILAASFIGAAASSVGGQDQAEKPAVLHIQRSVTTSRTGFPQFASAYRVLDGVQSRAEAQALTGTLSLENFTPNFSEVLWVLVDWQGRCPAAGASLEQASILWTDILKNPTQSTLTFPVNLRFHGGLPMTGCVGLVFAGGPLVGGKVRMSADLSLSYRAAASNPDTIIDLSGEYCFGQDWGCQNATLEDAMGFGVPVAMSAGHLVELFGNISDSTFDGTLNFGPLPTGDSWGAVNDFFLLRGGCGAFGDHLNRTGFPDPVPLTTLYSWVPPDAVHLDGVPLEYQIPEGATGRATLERRVERIFPAPVAVNSGDCMVVIYGRKGNGATDNETQVHALMKP